MRFRSFRKFIEVLNNELLKNTLKSINPFYYSDLAKSSFRYCFKYLALVILWSIIVMCIIAVPRLFLLRGYIGEQLDNVNVFSVNVTFETKQPIVLLENDPQVIIDGSVSERNMTGEKVLITKDFFYFRPFNSIQRFNAGSYHNLLDHKSGIANLIAALFVIIIPGVLIINYASFYIKYLVIMLAVSVIVFIAVRVLRFDISFKKILKIAFFASTAPLFIELISIPYSLGRFLIPFAQALGSRLYLVTLILLAVIMAFGILRVGLTGKIEVIKSSVIKKKKLEVSSKKDDDYILWQ
ncbi:MAG: DUF1189 family protein [Candidatus Woesearchaeota archaeon]|nr:DUF1189 family protein [Candidatus Woesearchaeota archaeon]